LLIPFSVLVTECFASIIETAAAGKTLGKPANPCRCGAAATKNLRNRHHHCVKAPGAIAVANLHERLTRSFFNGAFAAQFTVAHSPLPVNRCDALQYILRAQNRVPGALKTFNHALR
jgi:hypothetical protein